MDQSPESRPTAEPPGEPRRSCSGCFFQALAVGVIVFILAGVAMGPIGPGSGHIVRSAMMQQARQVGQVLFSYATDNTANGNAYPDGKNSTEVFQMLLDQGYATDPALFYVPMAGKVRPEPGQKKLKPENVSFDLTGGVTQQDSDMLPLVFLTGFRVTYAPGAAAVPIIKPFPLYGYDKPHDFFIFSWHETVYSSGLPSVAVFYKGNNAVTIVALGDSIPDFVSPSFNSKGEAEGKTYHQLTPDGVLH